MTSNLNFSEMFDIRFQDFRNCVMVEVKKLEQRVGVLVEENERLRASLTQVSQAAEPAKTSHDICSEELVVTTATDSLNLPMDMSDDIAVVVKPSPHNLIPGTPLDDEIDCDISQAVSEVGDMLPELRKGVSQPNIRRPSNMSGTSKASQLSVPAPNHGKKGRQTQMTINSTNSTNSNFDFSAPETNIHDDNAIMDAGTGSWRMGAEVEEPPTEVEDSKNGFLSNIGTYLGIGTPRKRV